MDFFFFLSDLFFLALLLNIITSSCYFGPSVTRPTCRVKSSHTSQCSPEWELGHGGTKAKRKKKKRGGREGFKDLKRLPLPAPPPWSIKHSSPNLAQGSYPHWSAGNGASQRQCASPTARRLLNWPSMQWVARVEEGACWIDGSALGRQDSVCFSYSGQLLSSEELIPSPSPSTPFVLVSQSVALGQWHPF